MEHVDGALPILECVDGTLPILEHVDGALPVGEHDNGALPIVECDVGALPDLFWEDEAQVSWEEAMGSMRWGGKGAWARQSSLARSAAVLEAAQKVGGELVHPMRCFRDRLTKSEMFLDHSLLLSFKSLYCGTMEISIPSWLCLS